MDTVLFLAYTGIYLVLLAWGLALAVRRRRWWTPVNVPLLVVAGLVYDNAVLGLGRFIGEGALLEGLNLPRYWTHALVTPLLVVLAWHVVVRAGVGWARTRLAVVGAWVAAGALVALEVTHVVGLELEARREHGVLSYAPVEEAGGPPLMVLLVSAALLVAGFLVWRRQGWVWLLVGTALMSVGSAVPVPVESGAVTNLFEVVLLTSVLATTAFQDRRERAGRAPERAGQAGGAV
ncbi:hypothetical protein SAMN05216184_11214 [Georgenia satyanarayanai]|uniref:Uncharacterized protein n=1 Tax=Georgenia satyanarayanai TaxID=860221 RepID=A0A2Y9ALV8_9MICO|nr:hypothetical protein [Georgenia satyanarayanai]PYF98270.1 hypothetical protein A8987_11214 [Georgenia satyanarayanai]SSA45155.1 hypothetical protein SAMN05216184_11214 [Georgenia satyanarayanai]